MPHLSTQTLSLPSESVCANAAQVYETGRKTCERLFDIAQHVTGDGKDDLLRAMLLFACSTIDSLGKRLAEDCLEELINKKGPDGALSGAQKQFEVFVKRTIDKDAAEVLSKVLTTHDYRRELINLLKAEIESASLQSFQQLNKLVSYLGISAGIQEIITQEDANKVFSARNTITHEMDIVATTGGGTPTTLQVQRAEEELRELTEKILEACKKLVEKVELTLSQ